MHVLAPGVHKSQHRWRLWLHLATTIVKGLLPAFELWLSTQLIQLVQDAIQKRTMSRSRLLVLSICKLASSYASEVIESLTADSSGELHHRVNTHVELKTMQACQGLDLVTLQRATTRKDLQAAAHLGSDSYEFVPATMAKLVSSIIGFIGQAAVAKRLAKGQHGDLAMLSLTSCLLLVPLYARCR